MAERKIEIGQADAAGFADKFAGFVAGLKYPLAVTVANLRKKPLLLVKPAVTVAPGESLEVQVFDKGHLWALVEDFAFIGQAQKLDVVASLSTPVASASKRAAASEESR